MLKPAEWSILVVSTVTTVVFPRACAFLYAEQEVKDPRPKTAAAVVKAYTRTLQMKVTINFVLSLITTY